MQSRSYTYFVSALIALMLVLLPITGQAQDKSKAIAFKIPAGALADALNLYSRQAGITLSYEERLVRGMSAIAISGDFHPQKVLLTLLKGTQLHAIEVGTGSWLIQPSQHDLMILDTIQVQGQDSLKDQAYKESASVSIITQDHIERFRGTSVGDIFQGTPGVLVSENRNSGGLDINIRGMQGQGRVPVMIDGSRQETTVYRGYSGVSSRSYIDPDLIGSLRIDKGPVMTAEGTGATGGAVSATTLTAEDIVKPGKLFGLRLRGSGIGNNSSTPKPGTYAGYYLPRNAYRSDCRFSTYCTDQFLMPENFAPEHGTDRPGLLEFGSYAGSLALAQRFEWGDLIAAYAQRQQGNYYSGTQGDTPEVIIGEGDKQAWYTETPVSLTGASRFRGGERIPNTNFASTSLLLKSNLFLPNDQSLDLSYIRYDSQYGEMMPSQLLFFGQAKQWLDSEVLNQTYTARYRWKPIEHDWADLKINFWKTDAITQLNTPGVGSVELENNIERTDDYQRQGTDISNSMQFYPIGVLELHYGVSGQWEDMDTETEKTEGFYTGSRSGWRNEFSAFTSTKWQPLTQWTLEAGIRHTRFNSKDNNPLPLSSKDPACQPDGNNGCLPVYYKNNSSGNAPIFSLSWEPMPGLQFYMRHAEALRMPSLFESTAGWSVSPALDIPLKAEHSTNKEIGINYLQSNLLINHDKIRIKLSYFQNHVDDYLTRTQPNAWETEQDGLDYFRLRNIDSLDLHGWELNFNYDAGTWLTELSSTRYSHIEVCNVGSNVRYFCNDWGLPQSYINNMIPPSWHANAHFGLRLFQQRFEIGVRATFMGKRNSIPQYNAPTGFNKPVLWRGYHLLDIYSKYKINETASVDFTIDNVTDRYYLDALSLGLVPAPGRTARLSFTLEI